MLWDLCIYICVCTTGFLQNVRAQSELHCWSVCHWQEWQCAHIHWGEHERQRAARASQRYKKFKCLYSVWLTFVNPSMCLMCPWKLPLTHNLSLNGVNNLIALKQSQGSLSVKHENWGSKKFFVVHSAVCVAYFLSWEILCDLKAKLVLCPAASSFLLSAVNGTYCCF